MRSVVEGFCTIPPNCYVAVDLSIKRTIKSNTFAVVKAPMIPTRSSAVTTKPSTDPRRTLDTVAVVRKPTLATHMSVVLEKSRIETGEASCRAVETSRMMTSPICASFKERNVIICKTKQLIYGFLAYYYYTQHLHRYIYQYTICASFY